MSNTLEIDISATQLDYTSSNNQIHTQVINELLQNKVHDIGNKDLPIYAYKEIIQDAVKENDIVIIRASTGGGKSTQVPQFLLECGFSKIILTQPRILAARLVKERIADELTTSLGVEIPTLVGYQAATEGDAHEDNIIEVPTDGLQMMREIHGNGTKPNQVLIIDEVHEWNANMSVLTAVAQSLNIKIVIMSATINTENLAEHYKDELGNPAPVIDVPGRTFEIEERKGDSLLDETERYAKEGKNILVFVPGVNDVHKVIAKMRERMPPGHTILPLYGEQPIAEQNLVLDSYSGGKIIVSTDVAKTSITIPDIDVVIDCGWERASETREDVPLLNILPASKACQDQRKGRVGRVRPGIYVLANLDWYPALPPEEERPDYDVPDLLRNRIDTILLRLLASTAISYDEINFVHKPDEYAAENAKHRLMRLGALALDGSVTTIGEQMSHLPLETTYARMMIEAANYSKKIQTLMAAAIVAHMDTGIVRTGDEGNNRFKHLSHEATSDILQMLDIYIKALGMTEHGRERNGIVAKKFTRASQTLDTILERSGLDIAYLCPPTKNEREQLKKCIVAGTDELFIPANEFIMRDKRGRHRKIAKSSSLRRKNRKSKEKQYIVGTPQDIVNMTAKGRHYTNIIKGATSVNTEMLLEVAPERCDFVPVDYIVSSRGMFKVKYEIHFDKVPTGSYVTEPAEASQQMYTVAVQTMLYEKLPKLNTPKLHAIRDTIRIIEDIQSKTANHLETNKIFEDIEDRVVKSIPYHLSNLEEIDDYLPTIEIDHYIPQTDIEAIYTYSPNSMILHGLHVPIKYSKGLAYITVPFGVLPDEVADATAINNERLRLRYKNTGHEYYRLEEIKDLLAREPRRERRKKTRQVIQPTTIGKLVISKEQVFPLGGAQRTTSYRR
jgi:HrpA-like RNA helicase